MNFQNLQAHQVLTPRQEIPEFLMSPEGSSSSLWNGARSSSEAQTAAAELNSNSSTTESEISNQTQEARISLKPITCPHEGCTKVYQGVEAHINLRRHVRCIHERREWNCPSCELHTGRRDNLRQHFMKKHPETIMPKWLMVKGRSRCRASSQSRRMGFS